MNYYVGDFPSINDFDAPRGWVCPKCGRVYSPNTSMCWYCGNTTTTITPNTNIPPDTTGSIPYKFPDIITSTTTIPIHYDVSSFLDNLIDNLEE